MKMPNLRLIRIISTRSQCRFMTTSKRVQDRSQNKRVQDLEIATENHKTLAKVLFLFEILKKEPENVISIRNLDQYRRQINLPKPHKLSEFFRKMPKLFELYKDQRGTLWCGMSEATENLIREEEEIIENHSDKAAEYITRMLMMAVDKRLAIDKLAHFRRDFGLPSDFRTNWVHKYSEYFRIVKPFTPHDEGEYLELVSWRPNWAITELEYNVLGLNRDGNNDDYDHVPGILTLAFPMNFPANYKKVYRYKGQIEHFQKREYLSPYADPRELIPGTQEFDKRAVAIMHELLSFTIEKRLVTDHLTHFRREFKMPQKLMRLLLKHFGIFYVSERGKRFSVFLKEAYESSELIEKHPLVVWKEKVRGLVGYRGKKRKIDSFGEFVEEEDIDLFESESEDDCVRLRSMEDDDEEEEEEEEEEEVEEEEEEEEEEEIDSLPSDGSDMDIEEIFNAYKD